MPNIAALVTVAAVMFAVLGAITLIAHIYNLNNIKSKTVGDGQHGTARWANKAEIRKTYRHIPFTPKKWRKQAKQNQTPTMTATAPRKLLRKKTEPTEEALPQGIVVGCKGGKHSHSYAAACCVGDQVLFQMLKANPNINTVCLCMDNDAAGQAANKRISDKLFIQGIKHEILVPEFKDWNEDLLYDEQEENECQTLQL